MADVTDETDVGLFAPLFADGRHLLTLGALGLLMAGGFALFLSAAGQFLPHDIQFLGMTAHDLCNHNACSIVHFMIHDRVSFGATLIALAVLYLWLIHFPLRARQPWAWWTLVLSNVAGFSSFLTYLGYGYRDTWHEFATLLLFPCFVIGLWLTFKTLEGPRHIRCLLQPFAVPPINTRAGFGKWLLLATAAGLFGAGTTITFIGMTVVFVPQDLEYMNTTVANLNELNPRLIPLIAHDRAGFGSCVLIVGFLMFACTWCAPPSRNLWQAITLAGTVGFVAAIGVHPIVGYNNPVHLAPACAGAITFFSSTLLMWSRRPEPRRTGQTSLPD